MKRTQMYVAGTVALLGSVALAGIFYLIVIFPKTMAVWADEGRSISVAEQILANLSSMCRTFGFFLIPLLMLAVIGCGVWAALAGIRGRQEPAGEQVDGTA